MTSDSFITRHSFTLAGDLLGFLTVEWFFQNGLSFVD